jgi:hypothetical protein
VLTDSLIAESLRKGKQAAKQNQRKETADGDR